MNRLNVFRDEVGCGWHFILRHPLKFSRYVLKDIKFGWQRVTRGWADCDVWNMDSWFLAIAPEMLRALADRTDAYPSQGFKTWDEWIRFLRNLADKFESCQEKKQEERNEWFESYIHGKGKDKELAERYFARAEAIAQESNETLCEAMVQFYEHFHSLWW